MQNPLFFKSNSSTVVTIRGLKATEEGKPASVKVSFQVRKTGKTSKYSYVSKVNVIDEKQAVTAAATGAKKVTVSFNKALATTSGVAITVKKGATTLSQKAVSFTDAKTAVVELNQSLTTGKYTADVAGLEEGAMTAEFAVDSEEYVAKIELLSTKAPMTAVSATSATISYTLKNQYEEVMQTSVNTPNFTISTAVTPDKGVYKNGKGSLTLKTNAAAFIPGDKVYISAVMQSGSHVATMSDQVEIVLPASFAKAEFKGVYNSTLKKMDTVQSAKLKGTGKYTYYVLFTVKDQYENDFDSVKQVIEASPLQFTALSTNPGFITTPTNLSSTGALKDFDVDGVTYVGVRLDAGTMSEKGGTATIQITSSTNGTQSTYEVVADAAGALDTLQIGTPAEYVVLGEKVEIPYEAKDQYGNAITSYDALNTNVTFTDGLNTTSKLAFEKQTDGSAKLYLNLKTQGTVNGVPNSRQDLVAYLTSVVNSNGNYSSTSVSIKPAAYPAAVLGINAKSSVTTTMPLNTSNVIIKYTDLDIADQYGRTMKSSSVEKYLSTATVATACQIYAIDATPGNCAVNTAAGTVVIKNATQASVTTNATAAVISATSGMIVVNTTGVDGSEKITFGIATGGTVNADNIETRRRPATEKTITFGTAKTTEFASYEIKDIDTMYYNVTSGTISTRTSHKADVTVYGVMADGTKVKLPYNTASMTSWDGSVNKGNLKVSGGAIEQSATYATSSALKAEDFQVSKNDKTYADVTATLSVEIKNASGSVIGTATKDFKLSNADPKAASVTFTEMVDVDKVELTVVQAQNLAATITGSVIDKQKDQYGKDFDESPKLTVGKVTASDVEDTFKVTSNGAIDAHFASGDVQSGDRFKVTLSYASGYSKTIYVVVR